MLKTFEWVMLDEIALEEGDILEFVFSSEKIKKRTIYYLILKVDSEYFSCLSYFPEIEAGFRVKEESFCFPIQKELYLKVTDLNKIFFVKQGIDQDLEFQAEKVMQSINHIQGLRQKLASLS